MNGTTRRALVYVPSGIDEPALLISLHGRGIGAEWNQAGMMKFEPIADHEKFIVVCPEALMDLNWDLGGTMDIDFVRQIIDDMAEQYGADRERVPRSQASPSISTAAKRRGRSSSSTRWNRRTST